MGKTLKEMDLNLSFDLRVEPLNHYKLDAATTQRLREGDIVALDDQYTFIQRIPRSHYVPAVGPVPYLYFLHQMRLLDIALMALIAFLSPFLCLSGCARTGKKCSGSNPPRSALARVI